ncbi:Fur family transcriptional regulator [Desulfovibrio legallii]|uniref:Zinc uptake regulator, Fur family n=1 Tax=Desulfovibrio legallii TaxID=571438 RepID=A0A1G7KK83_9BACT|nr:Fur family transcriptional regulator [Desulfovibrio legallii]SDF37454.1 zinc uptake regulator, Fur family [Desulfovibrio legallii]
MEQKQKSAADPGGVREVRGVRLTLLRRQVLTVLEEAGEPVKAYAIMDALRQTAARPIPPASVYRALDFLQQHGLAHKVETLNAFVACTRACAGPGTPVFMLVCDCCRQSREVRNPDLYGAIDAALHEEGFALHGGSIEIRGRCAACADAAPQDAFDANGNKKS